MTTLTADASVAASPGVYAPQHDSLLLIEAMAVHAPVEGRSVLDLCTGTGIVAIAAAQLGARRVTAIDVCRRAVRCTRRNARAAGVRIKAAVGTHADALNCGPYEVVLCNPPYVPADPHSESPPRSAGSTRAWDGGPDGRMVLDPLCDSAPDLLADEGVLLIVQSEFADPERTIRMLRRNRIYAEVVSAQSIPFGPVLNSQASWMESVGLLQAGRREEHIVVIRGEKL